MNALQVAEQLLPDAPYVVEAIASAASEVFIRAGCPDDFCIQSSGGVIVFGGRNRIVWTAKTGLQIARDYCTDTFIKAWEADHE